MIFCCTCVTGHPRIGFGGVINKSLKHLNIFELCWEIERERDSLNFDIHVLVVLTLISRFNNIYSRLWNKLTNVLYFYQTNDIISTIIKTLLVANIYLFTWAAQVKFEKHLFFIVCLSVQVFNSSVHIVTESSSS